MTRGSQMSAGVAEAHAPRRRCASAPVGVVLLEVVLALSLFFAAALVILAAVNSSLRTAQRVQMEAQASDLAVTLLSEVQMGLVPLTNDGPNEYEEEALVGWTWEIVVTPEDEQPDPMIAPLLAVEVIIRNDFAGLDFRLVQLMIDEFGTGGLASRARGVGR